MEICTQLTPKVPRTLQGLGIPNRRLLPFLVEARRITIRSVGSQGYHLTGLPMACASLPTFLGGGMGATLLTRSYFGIVCGYGGNIGKVSSYHDISLSGQL